MPATCFKKLEKEQQKTEIQLCVAKKKSIPENPSAVKKERLHGQQLKDNHLQCTVTRNLRI